MTEYSELDDGDLWWEVGKRLGYTTEYTWGTLYGNLLSPSGQWISGLKFKADGTPGYYTREPQPNWLTSVDAALTLPGLGERPIKLTNATATGERYGKWVASIMTTTHAVSGVNANPARAIVLAWLAWQDAQEPGR